MEEYLKKINSSDSHGEQSINWVTHQKCHDMFILSKVRTYIDTYIRVFYNQLNDIHRNVIYKHCLQKKAILSIKNTKMLIYFECGLSNGEWN